MTLLEIACIKKFLVFLEDWKELVMTNNTTKPVTEKKKSNNSLLIVLALLLLGTNGYHIYQKLQDNSTIEENTNTINSQKEEISQHEASIDSLQSDIQVKIDSLTALGEDVTRYQELSERLESEKKALSSENFNLKRSKRRLEGIVAGLKEQLVLMEEDNIRLSNLTEEQNKTIEEKNISLAKKENEIREFEIEQAKADAIIADAAILKADKFQIVSVKNNKPKAKSVYKSKDLATMQVSFTIFPNKVNNSGSKEVFVQIKEPSGSTIYDLSTGGGEFDLDGTKAFYTKKLETLYDKTEGKKVIFTYENSQEYKSGTNTIDVYCEGHLIGTGSFTVK